MNESPSSSCPGRYVERVSLETGEVLDHPPRPEELLVHDHRDGHPVDVHARYMMSRTVRSTGSERVALRRLQRMRGLARKTSERLGRLVRNDPDRLARFLFGLDEADSFFRFKRPEIASREWAARVLELAEQASARLERAFETPAGSPDGANGGIRVLLTGATGFIGKEILWQAARDSGVAEVVAVIRPRVQRDPESGEENVSATAAQRGHALLDSLGIRDEAVRARFRFLDGDVEKPRFGLDADAAESLAASTTHLVHCAASVAFDDPYEASYRANVLGTLNALRLSRDLHRAPNSAFVAHIGIETSYIHGRRLLALAREDHLSFPRNYYNNYYELTKAMASLETERFMLEERLPVVQLCPSIVIGDHKTGNNRGDTKVVNAPVNLFGRAHEAVVKAKGPARKKAAERRAAEAEDPDAGGAKKKKDPDSKGKWLERSKVTMLARLASVFPSDPSAEINLIPVDRVAAGVLAALRHPRATGRRVHLANDQRITAQDLITILHQELDVRVRLIEPTLHRTVGLPVMGRLLGRLGAQRVVDALDKMTDIFGGYAEWGQPVHQVGNDVRLLGLSAERPDPHHAFRMLCRHNRYVQRYGRVRAPAKLAQREHDWNEFLRHLEVQEGQAPGTMSAEAFREAVKTAGFTDQA